MSGSDPCASSCPAWPHQTAGGPSSAELVCSRPEPTPVRLPGPWGAAGGLRAPLRGSGRRCRRCGVGAGGREAGRGRRAAALTGTGSIPRRGPGTPGAGAVGLQAPARLQRGCSLTLSPSPPGLRLEDAHVSTVGTCARVLRAVHAHITCFRYLLLGSWPEYLALHDLSCGNHHCLVLCSPHPTSADYHSSSILF